MSTPYNTIFSYVCEQYGHTEIPKMTYKIYDGDYKKSDAPLLFEARLDLELSVELTNILKKMNDKMVALSFVYSKQWNIGATTHGITTEGFHGVTFNTAYFTNRLQRKYILLHEARHCYQNHINFSGNTEVEELDADIYALNELDKYEIVRDCVVTNQAIKGLNFRNDEDLLSNLKARLALLQN